MIGLGIAWSFESWPFQSNIRTMTQTSNITCTQMNMLSESIYFLTVGWMIETKQKNFLKEKRTLIGSNQNLEPNLEL